MADTTPLSPPVAAKKPSSVTHHGITVSDDYAWLRDADYPKVDDKEVAMPAGAVAVKKMIMKDNDCASPSKTNHTKNNGLLDPIREVWGGDVERAHAGMQPFERAGVVGW